MIEKMRWRFTGVAIAAAICVLTALVIVVNVFNSYITVQQVDTVLLKIAKEDTDKLFQQKTNEAIAVPPSFFKQDENLYTIFFFDISCDFNGNIRSISNDDTINSITYNDASEYLNAVVNKKQDKGFYKTFRWKRIKQDYGYRVIFLDVSAQTHMIRVFIYLSWIIEVIILFILFILLWLFSRKAIEPFAKNIEYQKQFITNASHEIKTPLTSIMTSTDILAIDNKDNEWVDNIRRQTTRLTKLVSDLVTLSRLDETVPFPEKMDFPLSEAVKTAAQPFDAVAKATGKHFTKAIEEGLIMHGDLFSIQQMISILLDNAMKYSCDDGDIQLKVYKKRKNIMIEVSNKCDLKDTKDLKRIFDRFYRIDKSHNINTGGNGIGLSIAKAVAVAHKGIITAESKDGKSICIKVKL